MVVRFLFEALKDRRANFAVLSALMVIPLALSVGFAIDGSRYYKARAHLQDAIDTAAIAVAASDEQDGVKLKMQAEDFVHSNLAANTIEGVVIDAFDSSPDEIQLNSSGFVRTTFMRLANVESMPVAATTMAKRAPIREVEVALVLDNTYSMVEADPITKETRIATLRKAAKGLIETLLVDGEKGSVSIALVPYADHVNVGAGYRTASWLQLDGAERTESGGGDRKCETVKLGVMESYCKSRPKTTCTRTRDGVVESYSCDDASQCTLWAEREKTETTCTGTAAWSNTYKFYGCVGTRATGTLRLSDDSPTLRYPAYVETRQNCAQPIIPLTKDLSRLLTATAGMTHQPSSYVANTHIPSGLVWGLNVLSPGLPFDEAQAYDERNQAPRKILILMTDGDNTLKYRASDGKHVDLSSNAKTRETDAAKVDGDSTAICANVRAKNIELYSVAFAVKKESAKAVLRQCATSAAHYYDATDAAKLAQAFSGIARSISQVRIAR